MMLKMFILNNRMFLLNLGMRKLNVDGVALELLSGLEAMEDELKEVGISELLLIMIMLIMALLTGFVLLMLLINGTGNGVMIMLVIGVLIPDLFSLNDFYGRSTDHMYE